jgi:hypothetical protein
MTREEWDRISDDVTQAMLEHTRPFTTPLTTETDSTVRLIGSGSYIQHMDKRLLLTCEHVACEHVARQKPVNFRFFGSENVYKSLDPWIMDAHPFDAAVQAISDRTWSATVHRAAVIPGARLAIRHQTSHQAELLFFRGFAGENACYGFGIHEANATGYCTQEVVDSGDGQFFEMFWEPQQTSFASGISDEARAAMKLDNPGGFSGSLVWNTRFLQVLNAGGSWAPQDAVVTGLLRRWDTSTKTLLVWRVEHLRAWLFSKGL